MRRQVGDTDVHAPILQQPLNPLPITGITPRPMNQHRASAASAGIVAPLWHSHKI